MIRIAADRATVDPSGPPPTFTLRSDRANLEVEIATDRSLLTGALAARRTERNYFSAREVGPLARTGARTPYELDSGAWASLSSARYLYYRAVAYDGTAAAPVNRELSITDANIANAPSISLPRPVSRILPRGRRFSGALTWLRVSENRLVDEAGDTVVLRGVTRTGLEYTGRNAPDPTGTIQRTSRLGAGMTRDEIREIVRDWGANVIRLPLNQEWALTRRDYVLDVDGIVQDAAAEGAYTLLSIGRFDRRRTWGGDPADPNRTPPLPEATTIDLWRKLANRYRDEPAVLYEIFAQPHAALPTDTEYRLNRPGDEPGWIALWHSWVRRIEEAVHRRNGRALIFVSGWDWGLSLRSFPVPLRPGRPLPNAVYSSHVFFSDVIGRSTQTDADFEHWFGFPRLRQSHPIYVGEWGGEAARIGWGDDLEEYMRDLHRYTDGLWQGLAGWTATSWADAPLLIQRGDGSRGRGRQTVRWRTFRRSGRRVLPTEFGELVRGALRTHLFAPTADFDRARPAGSRTRYRIDISTPRHGDFFTVLGHDFTPGTEIAFTPTGGGRVRMVTPTTTLEHVLIVDRLPDRIPLGAVTVDVRRPDGARTEPVAATVVAPPADPLPELALLTPGLGLDGYTILIIANPVVQRLNGTLAADPIVANRARFHRAVARIVRSLYGQRESLLRPYARQVRIVARFHPEPVAAANALCQRLPGGITQPFWFRFDPYLAAAGFQAAGSQAVDVVYAVTTATAYQRSWAFGSGDPAGPGPPWRIDARTGTHGRTTDRVGSIALFEGRGAEDTTPMHEFVHASSDGYNAFLADLYLDGAPDPTVANKRWRATAGARVPRHFALVDNVAYLADRDRTYAASWRSYHSARIDPTQPNLMDGYATRQRPQLDFLTRRFLRDRIESKLGR